MNITGIITEYNPFHLGHKLHLEKAKEDTNCDGVICIMSGNFMQRGMPALIDKWTRAKIAVLNGVDLVIELPLIYSLSSAEGFANGAVKILTESKVTNNLYFGSEHGVIDDLLKISDTLTYEDSEFQSLLKTEVNKGLPFHTARMLALQDFLPDINCNDILNNSNNILAIEYLKALSRNNSNIKPYTLKRCGADYNEKEIKTSFPSATSIRNMLETEGDLNKLKNSVTHETFGVMNELISTNYSLVYPEKMFQFIKYKLLTEGYKLKNIKEASEGLDNKILKEISNSSSLDEFILNIKSKRYTYTRINRILTSFFIGLENYDLSNIVKNNPSYIRPLAFNSKGSKILKEIKKNSDLDIITKLPKSISNEILNLDILGTKAYSILNNSISPYEDYLKSPIYLP